MRTRLFSTEDARQLAKRRLPRLVFDFIDGAAGREIGIQRNEARFDDICLQPRVMENVASRNLTTEVLGQKFGVPFGVAPMGMCNLICPGADRILAQTAVRLGMPVCVSSAASSTLEEMREWAGTRAWFQLYYGHSEESSLAAVERAGDVGYETLLLTVDVPQVSRRVRDQRNGFNVPFRLTPTSFFDFATHPRWSLTTLIAGIPSPKNSSRGDNFVRDASRAGADWNFLAKLRKVWKGNLIIKGITCTWDAVRVRDAGADAVYVSNHGGRQMDSVPAAIDILPRIRAAVGTDIPLIFDSGVRDGEDVVKALALGANFVMLGRPLLFALGAGGEKGLSTLLDCFVQDTDAAIAQLGVNSVANLWAGVLFEPNSETGDKITNLPQSLKIAGRN